MQSERFVQLEECDTSLRAPLTAGVRAVVFRTIPKGHDEHSDTTMTAEHKNEKEDYLGMRIAQMMSDVVKRSARRQMKFSQLKAFEDWIEKDLDAMKISPGEVLNMNFGYEPVQRLGHSQHCLFPGLCIAVPNSRLGEVILERLPIWQALVRLGQNPDAVEVAEMVDRLLHAVTDPGIGGVLLVAQTVLDLRLIVSRFATDEDGRLRMPQLEQLFQTLGGSEP